MIKAVCFDFGGVLVRIARSWNEACERAGIDPASSGGSEADMVRAIGPAADLQTGSIEFEEFIERCRRNGMNGLGSAELRAVHAGWLIEEFEGMRQIIERLNDLGIHTAALSNTDAEHWKTLQEMSSISRLRSRILSFEIGFRKPAPEIYHAAETMMDIPGSSILLLDDLPENVDAALRCGWQALLVDPHGSIPDQTREALLTHGVELGDA
ncbi:MAG TPA: hypothetical protein DCX60_06445 [Phycisphaerales bacterium]|nr:hypothetical protein [Phycisphaerales bacterium]